MNKILVSDCCGAEQDDFFPDVCPRCREFCTFAAVIDEPNLDEIEPEEETHESLTGGFRDPEPPSYGLSDEDELKANFEDLPDEEEDELDDLPNDWEPDWNGADAREQQLRDYNQKF